MNKINYSSNDIRCMNNFKNNVRAYIAAKGMTQAELARQSGLDDSTINRVVNKTEDHHVRVCIRISSALNIKLDDLFMGRYEFARKYNLVIYEPPRECDKIKPEDIKDVEKNKIEGLTEASIDLTKSMNTFAKNCHEAGIALVPMNDIPKKKKHIFKLHKKKKGDK